MVTLIERYLTEDIEAVKRQYSYIPEEDFDRIIRLDPTFDENRDSVGKYGKWLLNLYKKEPDAYNNPNLPKLLAKYDELKNDRRYNIEKDIMRLRSTNDLENAIGSVETNTLSKKQAQRQAKKDNNYDLVFETKDYWVFVPKNHEGDMALASYGGSSKALWCTAADSENGKWRYDYYLKQGGKYYVLINKNNYGDKYQFHFESDQFMDSDNRSISYEDFCKKQEGLEEFFVESEGKGNAASVDKEAHIIETLFELDPDRDTDEQMQEERTKIVSSDIIADYVENFMERKYNDEFVRSVCWYIKDGTEDFWYEGYGNAGDFDYISVNKNAFYDDLVKAGFTEEMIDDFCDDVGGFYKDLKNGEYNEVEDIDLDEIADALYNALEEASYDARSSAYSYDIINTLDNALVDCGVRKNQSDESYTVYFIYEDVKDALEDNGEYLENYELIEAIDFYLQYAVFGDDFNFEEPYYGFDDSPQDDVLADYLSMCIGDFL